jgi:hypothetical protein
MVERLSLYIIRRIDPLIAEAKVALMGWIKKAFKGSIVESQF